MMVTIYHNPRCSKSRQTLQLLQDNNVSPEVVEYLKTPLNKVQLTELISKLGISVRDIIRKSEQDYKDHALSNSDLSDDALLNAIVEAPKLMQRPIVVNGKKAVIGRPPENVLEIL